MFGELGDRGKGWNVWIGLGCLWGVVFGGVWCLEGCSGGWGDVWRVQCLGRSEGAMFGMFKGCSVWGVKVSGSWGVYRGLEWWSGVFVGLRVGLD